MLYKRFLSFYYQRGLPSLLTPTLLLFSSLHQKPLFAQTPQLLQPENRITQTQPPADIFRRPEEENPPIAPETPPVIPPPEKLFPTPSPTPDTPETVPNVFPETIIVERFEVIGSTVFSSDRLAATVKEFTNRPITSVAELQLAAEAISQLYRDEGYITSGAVIPANQTFKKKGGVVTIQVLEGQLENIQVRGLRRLNPNYIRSRIQIATDKPLNVNRLLRALQLLQLNPLIRNISAELAAGSTSGTNVLDVRVTEAKTLSAQISLDNNRSPSVGSFQRRIQLNQANLLGLGDGLSVSYTNTEGSNDVDARYTLPINPYNGTLEFGYSYTNSNVIEDPFDRFDIEGTSQDFSLTLRQPIVQTPNEEFALGLTASRRESEVDFLGPPLTARRVGFPVPGSDDGNTRLSILRFFQDWTKRSSRQVFAVRSQFSFGLDVFNATTNEDAPDARFFSWRGQAQWVRRLAPDTLLLISADAQLADRALVPLEQFGLGGQRTVRGYRQDLLLTDNAFSASAELRYPILRVPQVGGVLQITPFVDYGTVWNSSGNADPDPSNLASIGLGLLWQSNRLSARFDYGIPLVSVDSLDEDSLQEKGLYFSIVYTQPF
ncbi:BamA/TamA family outer membrane protein [Scytonema sp. UIC 10036]|uniref:ShlB/FhaC/HecB family hemolysin secretion/activation protein n=1 Tax=Scytonema sp. UIC 10036 TaxID=2304196 RepID=UPI0012DABD4D|nr:ShlB/FhaC/HecB family hemolysin secretion/activation protein [Scytonema sp. UIC 10036]MUG95314.1 BamA/TamA family outer membrane protein [Scytonema sp. UIC 10036]